MNLKLEANEGVASALRASRSKPDSHLHRLEMGRGLAALVIVLYHANAVVQTPKYFGQTPFGGIFTLGWFGVEFFFVLSGFILLHIHRDDLGCPKRWKRYALKRFIRIYPPYWVILVPVVAIYFLQPSFGTGTERDATRLLTSVLLAPHAEWPVLPVAWSLRHEVVFYVLFGVMIANRNVGLAVLVAWQGAIALDWMIGRTNGPVTDLLLDVRNLDFGLGMIAAVITRRFEIKGASAWTLAGGAGLIAFSYGQWRGAWPISMDGYRLGYGVLSMVTVIGLAASDLAGKRPPPAPFRWLGAASYSVYLVHYPVLSALAKMGHSMGWDRILSPEVMCLLFAGVATGAGILTHQVVEKPLLHWMRRVLLPEKPDVPRRQYQNLNATANGG